MNILVTSLNFDYAQEIAQKIAKKLKCKVLNANELFNKTLLLSIGNPILLVDEELNLKETELCLKVSNFDGVVAISDDMFISNENYKYFKNSQKILVFSKNLGKIKKNIENLVKQHCNYSINYEDDLDKLLATFKR